MDNLGGKYIKLLRLLWLIPIVTLAYIGWVNLLPFGGTITHAIDVGSDDTAGMARITGPFDRISEIMEDDSQTYRELEQALVYFEVEDNNLTKAGKVIVSVRFRDNFPADTRFLLGARNGPGWDYSWKEIYVPFYQELSHLTPLLTDNSTVIYTTGRRLSEDFTSVDDFLQNPPPGSVIATNDKNLPINLTPVNAPSLTAGAPDKWQIINTPLRGNHTIWTYVTSELLEFKVIKQDLNWYEEPDELTVGIYTTNDDLLTEVVIPDDGDSSVSKEMGPLQEETIAIDVPGPGAYRIELQGSDDLLINQLEINQARLVVADRLYLAGNNQSYFPGASGIESVTLYGKNYRENTVDFYTWHNSGLQSVSISGDGYEETINIDLVKTHYPVDIGPGTYQVSVPRQDVLISTNGYFSFSPEAHFLPRRCQLRDIKYSMDLVLEIVDYIVFNTEDYTTPEADDGWLSARTQWSADELFIENNKLGFCFNIPHLSEAQDFPIAIDRIDIILEIEPVWKRP